MKNNYFNKLQLCSILIVLIVVPFIGGGALSLFKSAGVDAYFSVIIGGILGILNLFIFIYIFSYKEETSIRDKIIIYLEKSLVSLSIQSYVSYFLQSVYSQCTI